MKTFLTLLKLTEVNKIVKTRFWSSIIINCFIVVVNKYQNGCTSLGSICLIFYDIYREIKGGLVKHIILVQKKENKRHKLFTYKTTSTKYQLLTKYSII